MTEEITSSTSLPKASCDDASTRPSPDATEDAASTYICVEDATGDTSKATKASATSKILASPGKHASVSDAREQKPSMRKGTSKLALYICSVLVAVLLGAGVAYACAPWPAPITLNGDPFEATTKTTIADLISSGAANPQPGDLLAIDGTIIQAGEGEKFEASVNGRRVYDLTRPLLPGDNVVISDGADITESFTEDIIGIVHKIDFVGTGAIHLYTVEGVPGRIIRQTGNVSQKVLENKVREAEDGTVSRFNAQTGGEKLVALTFDDGPWDPYTAQILDILKENQAKATFFTIGYQLERHADVVRRAHNEGHQIGTHTWDHASGSGKRVNLALMSSEEQINEVEKGIEAISAITGAEASRVIRAPGGNFSEETARIIGPFITAEIGWNVETKDWEKPGANVIASRILQAAPGDIVLMHDGGGDRSQTVEALRIALPQMTAEGYRFVTIDELIAAHKG